MAVYTTNKKASMDYELLDRFEAGIELFGLEVKSIRKKQMKLEGSRVLVRGGEAYLLNAAIPPYQPSNTPKDYDPERPRRLLFNKKELLELSSKESQKGLTIIPVSVYNKGRNIKIEVRVARRKKKTDKREDLKKRDAKRSMERVMNQNTQ